MRPNGLFWLCMPLLVLLFATKSCDKADQFSLDTPFTLAAGQGVSTADGELSIFFASVAEDSRCPQGVQCMQAGRVTVVLAARADDDTPQELKLTLDGGRATTASRTAFRNYEIVLQAVDPYPTAEGGKIAAADYRARLVVTTLAAK